MTDVATPESAMAQVVTKLSPRSVADSVVRRLGKSGIVADVPKERVRVEEEPHRPSKESRISSGSGSGCPACSREANGTCISTISPTRSG